MKKIISFLLPIIVFAAYSYISSQKPSPQTLSANQHISSSITPTPEQVSSQPTSSDLYPVVKVVDGDTIEVLINEKKTKIRLIGIDTPEVVDPRKPVQCFGKEASNHAKEMLTGKEVRLVADPTQGDKDKYGRLLRYVFLPDGTNFNLQQIAEGYAFEYTYDIPYQYQTEFRQAQQKARDTNLGLWATSTCNGKHG
ncbi:MAG TPA: thermonuclease family protein [Candidatus Saccharimonadales bacterium]|nr:thermonuclease family protein [Candidatus Saccharimonadales bacterium]